MRNGPKGEFQLTPKPTETRGLGESPRKRSVKGEIALRVSDSVVASQPVRVRRVVPPAVRVH